MSTFSSCPKCAKPITIPREAEPADMVRCPLCSSEYMLAEALANAPPQLLLIRSLGVVGREEPHDEPMDGGSSDLHLFDHASSDLSDGPTIDLSDSPQIDDEEPAPKFDVAGDETLPGNISFGETESARSATSDFAERDTEIEESAASAPSDSGFDLDSPTVAFDAPAFDAPAFDMSAAADEDSPHVDAELPLEDAEQMPEEIELTGFGDESDDAPNLDMPSDEIPSLDMPADDEHEMALAGAGHSDEAEPLASASRRERRKPSALIGLIFMASSLPVAAIGACAILWWAVGVDPVGLAPKLPSYLSFLAPKALASPPAATPKQLALAPAKGAVPEENTPFATNVPPLTPRAEGDKPVDPTLPKKTPTSTPDDADEPGDDMDEPADAKPVVADDPGDDNMTDEPATEDATADEPEENMAEGEEEPVKPVKPVKKPARVVAADPAEGEDVAMEDEPSEATEPAEDMPSEVADNKVDDNSTEDTPDSAAPDDGTDVATTEPADVPGGDVAAPEEATDEPAEAAVAVGPHDKVHYSADDVEKGLTEARDAGTALAGADKDGLKKAKAQYYRKLAQLAELATFADPAEENSTKVRDLLGETAADRARLGVIAKAGGQWIALSKGKEHQGVVLSGAVQSVSKQGLVYETKILLPDGMQTISVLSAHKLPIAANDQALVLGSIVSDPAKAIDGYQGAESTVVWSGMVIKAPGSG